MEVMIDQVLNGKMAYSQKYSGNVVKILLTKSIGLFLMDLSMPFGLKI